MSDRFYVEVREREAGRDRRERGVEEEKDRRTREGKINRAGYHNFLDVMYINK